jgi:Mycoplasma protein of unknown function, DUF285
MKNERPSKFPYTLEELKSMVREEMAMQGDAADLNHIDVRGVSEMSRLFEDSAFNGNISRWDMGRVKNTSRMFMGSKFTGDISDWNVSKVWQTSQMFAYSSFSGDLSRWNVESIEDMSYMFSGSAFNGSVAGWKLPADDVPGRNDVYLSGAFHRTPFCGDLRAWGLKKEKLIRLFDGPIGDSHFMPEYHRYKEMRESIENKEALLKNFEAQCRDIFVDESHGRKIGLMKTLPL